MLNSFWLLTLLITYGGGVRWITLRADRRIPRSFKRLPYRTNWPLKRDAMSSRSYALWNLPVTGGVAGVIVLGIDLWFEAAGQGLQSLQERLLVLGYILGLALAGQWLILRMIGRWVARKQEVRNSARRR